MKNKTLDSQKMYERLLLVTGSKNDASLASSIGISHQSFYSAKVKGRIPPSWIIEVAQKFSISTDYIFFGVGKIKMGEDDIADMQEELLRLQQENANLKQDLDMYRSVIKAHQNSKGE